MADRESKKNDKEEIAHKGDPIVRGMAEGAIIATTVPLSFWGGFDPLTGEIIDRHHPLSGCNIADKILVLPSGRGSSSGSGVLLEAIMQGTAPSGILLNKYDEMIALGAIVSQEVFSRSLPVIKIDDDSFSQSLDKCYACIDIDAEITFV